jgi:CheY-like chemotaxis protein
VPRIVVIHYDPAEAASLASRVSREGFEAEGSPVRGGAIFRQVRDHPPDAILIDLMRMPSYGRWAGVMLREQKGTRRIPLVFLEGDPAKTRMVRRMLPDAVYTTLAKAGDALRQAIGSPPGEPVVPSPLEIPAAHKLRIGKDSVVGLVNGPAGFDLGKLPAGAKVQAKAAGANVILVFVKSAAGLGRALPGIAKEMEAGRKWWILWPKKASGTSSDLSMPRIFEMCTPYGLAAHKLCAVDETWSALGVGRSRISRRGSR